MESGWRDLWLIAKEHADGRVRITDVEVLDADAFNRYRELAGAPVARFGGRFLVRGAEPDVAEGEWPSGQRLNVIEFLQLKAWYDSPEYAPAREIATSALRRRLLFVEGVDPK